MKKTTAIKRAKSANQLAKMLGISRQAVSKWADDVPQQQVDRLRELKPQWFAKPRSKAAEAA